MERQEQAKQLFTRCLNLGISALRSDLAAIDVIKLVVRELETDPFFNSGRASTLTAKGTVEMESRMRRRFGINHGKATKMVDFARVQKELQECSRDIECSGIKVIPKSEAILARLIGTIPGPFGTP
ncbi:hypothetical protein FF1_015299 [Malus domestica]